MTTFSQLVDDIVAESMRPDLRNVIASNLNFTIRELHVDPRTKLPLKYGANLQELEVLADTDQGFVWKIPRIHLFQNLEAVYYPATGVLPKQRYPGSAMAYVDSVDGLYYFYRTGDAFAFSGYGGAGSQLYIAWYERLRRLQYKPKNQRLVTWDEENEEWVFDPSIAGDPEAQEQALANSTHWMLQRWSDLLGQGTRAKIFARLGDQDRARLSYSLYENMRPGLVTSESFEFVPQWNRP